MFTTTAKFISLDGKLVPEDEARLHVLSPAVKYGLTVFEGICGYGDHTGENLNIFRLREHLVRLQQSMHIMRYDRSYTVEEMTEQVIEVVRANEVRDDCHIRLSAHILGTALMDATGPVALSCGAVNRPRRALDDKAVRASISSWARIDEKSMPPRVKVAANYHNGRLGEIQAKADGYDKAIFLTGAGKVAEGAGACLFMVRDGIPATPIATEGILESITRASILDIFADDLGMPATERVIDRTELYLAEEVFFCGSAYEVTPIVNVDGLDVGDGKIGPVTRAVWDTYQGAVRGESARRQDWLTAVYSQAAVAAK